MRADIAHRFYDFMRARQTRFFTASTRQFISTLALSQPKFSIATSTSISSLKRVS